ncbi:THAP domain containing 10 [Phyllostomus discolor]|uniref:THAP domain containing 10 n=1 Tax=Phyllostomus discolor TaxID=89673 RepID=A0A834EXY1_9CHIR|nr:THAP domain containing 10 [Phyllostomus discolor]
METAISGLVLSQIYWLKQPLESLVLFVRAGTKLATSVTMTTTTSGPCVFTAHLSSVPGKFVSLCGWLSAFGGGLPGGGGRYPRARYGPDLGLQFSPSGGWRYEEETGGQDAASTGSRRAAGPASPSTKAGFEASLRLGGPPQPYQVGQVAVALPQGPCSVAAVGQLRVGPPRQLVRAQ